MEDIIRKIIESRHIGICPISDKTIYIGRRLPQIIGDFRELSEKYDLLPTPNQGADVFSQEVQLVIRQ